MLLRVLAAHGLFDLNADGEVTLTRAGGPLRSDHPRSMRSTVRLFSLHYKPLAGLDYTLATGEPAFEHINGMSMFEFLRLNPDKASIFDGSMAEFSLLESSGIVRDYDFSSYRRIIDIGGGSGRLLAAVLATQPDSVGVVFDQPYVVERVAGTAAEYQVGDRLEASGGDFFVEVPADGDLYILKSIIHDWPDEDAIRILSTCRKAIPAHGRLVLFERAVLPDQFALQTEQYALLLHLLFGGRERTIPEFERLFTASGFQLDRVTPTVHGHFAVEAVPV